MGPGPTRDPLDATHGFRTLYCGKCGHMIAVRIDCGHRFCPLCSRRRARRVRNRLQALLQKNKKVPKAGVKLLTLSKANCKDLPSGIKDLVASFRRLRQRALWKHYVLGGAFVIEIKGRPGNWHPHIHAIIYSYYIPWARLRAAWRQCSGGTAVWISSVSNDRAVGYVTKYITKCDMPPALLDGVSSALRLFRLFTRFGCWHNIVLPALKFDCPCQQCNTTDWMVDFKILHGKWREMRPGQLIPTASGSVREGAKAGQPPVPGLSSSGSSPAGLKPPPSFL